MMKQTMQRDKNEEKKFILRLLKTCVSTLLYACVWMILEKLIYGTVMNRLVDNIMLLLFVPMIYKSMRNKKQ